MLEIWRNVNVSNYSEFYQVSSLGNVMSTRRKILMRKSIRGGYHAVTLCLDYEKQTFPIHRLVALTFIQKPLGLDIVNHKDGNRLNNTFSNLEWTSLSGNAQHAIDTLKIPRKGITINQYDLSGEFIGSYDSVKEAADASGTTATSFNRLSKKFIWEKEEIEDEQTAPDGRQIPDYPGYIVTHDGKIFSVKTNKFLILKEHPSGYYRVNLSKGKLIDIAVHVLVAKAYLDPIPGKDQVNHKDRNKKNNCVENLEWVSNVENMQHVLTTDTSHVHRKSVKQFSLDGKELGTFDSIKDAANLIGIDPTGISYACRGKQQTAGGYLWRYNNQEHPSTKPV